MPDERLPALVAAASAFAFPSVKEGFGLAAMEALVPGRALAARYTWSAAAAAHIDFYRTLPAPAPR